MKEINLFSETVLHRTIKTKDAMRKGLINSLYFWVKQNMLDFKGRTAYYDVYLGKRMGWQSIPADRTSTG